LSKKPPFCIAHRILQTYDREHLWTWFYLSNFSIKCKAMSFFMQDHLLISRKNRKSMRLVDDTPVNNHFSGGYRHGRQNDYENQTGIDAIPAPV
jgi:hypothetical protein